MEKITFLNLKKKVSYRLFSLVFLAFCLSLAVPVNAANLEENIPYYTDTDGDGVPDNKDIDSDNDGIIDTVEDENLDGDDCYWTNPTDTDGDGVPDYLDIDSDDDGIIDNIEAQPTNGYIPPSGKDVDGNGLDDAYEETPGSCGGLIPVDTDYDHVPDYKDIDSDNDGILDNVEAQTTSGYIPPSGKDIDGNGLDDAYEETPGSCGGLTPIDTDSDYIKDFRDIDSDNDGILDNIEAQHPDHIQTPCGIDKDKNGLDDHYESYPGAGEGITPINSDTDPLPNFRDIDSDDDGIPDNVEGQTTAGYIPPSGLDDDNDGLDNAYEGSGDEGINPENTDGEDNPDYLDKDTDNDLVADNNEGNDFNFDGIPDQTYTGTDTDNDGLDDGYEGSDVNDGYDVNDEIDDPANDLPDTDGTEDVNYRDFDDDGDGIDTPDEDVDDDGDPTDDDTDDDGTPDYLDPTDDRNVIDAVDDSYTSDSSGGVVTDSNVLSNDTLDGEAVTLSDVILTSTPTDELTINEDGSVTVAEGTPEGTYTIEYTICEIADTDNCDTATVTVEVSPDMVNVIDAVDDTYASDTTGGQIPDSNVLSNDTLDGESVTLSDVTLTSTPTDELTINEDGSVTVAEGTPEGTYTIEYTICEIADTDNCDTATVTVEVSPDIINVIDAVDDTYTSDSSGGVVTDSNVLSNDTLDGESVTLSDVTLTSTPTDELTINEDGSVTVAEGTPEGTYTIEYTICEIADTDNCDTATVTVEVSPDMVNVIDAVDDTYASDTTGGQIPDSNVLSNDTLDGESVTLSDVILTSTPTDELTINEDGSVTVAEGTPEGTYTIEYTICEIADTDNCDTATVTVEVSPDMVNVIDAVDDTYASDTTGGQIPDSNVLSNDTLDGESVTLSDVILTSTPTDELTINEDGSVTVAEGTPEGTYTIEYTICEIADVDNCDTGTVTVEVGPGMVNIIDAIDDTYSADGSGVILNSDILLNDTLNGESIALSDVILTSTPTNELTVNENGTVSVLPGTSEGTYTIEYTICEVANPDNCDTAIVTVSISIEDVSVNQMLTPNGDLKNDFLFIRGVKNIKTSSIRIFNRWGVAVYEGKNYDNVNNVFDGRSRGRSTLSVNDYLPAGVYFYIFDYETDEGSFTDSEYIYISR